MKKFALILAVLPLAACAGTTQMQALSAVEIACASADAALATLIEFNAKLTPAQRANIAIAARTVNPVCTNKNPDGTPRPLPTLAATTQAALESAVATLVASAALVKN